MPGSRIAFGVMVLAKRRKGPRPFRIEHRYIAQELLHKNPTWGEWVIFARYTTAKERNRELIKLLEHATGRWEYRIRDVETY